MQIIHICNGDFVTFNWWTTWQRKLSKFYSQKFKIFKISLMSQYVILEILDLIKASTQNIGKIMCCARISVFHSHTRVFWLLPHMYVHTLLRKSLKIINQSWGLGHLMHSLHNKLLRYPLHMLYFLQSAEKMHFLMK